MIPGSKISGRDDLSVKTRLIVGYQGPFYLPRTAYKIAGPRYKGSDVVYYFPGTSLVTGDRIRDFCPGLQPGLLFSRLPGSGCHCRLRQ